MLASLGCSCVSSCTMTRHVKFYHVLFLNVSLFLFVCLELGGLFFIFVGMFCFETVSLYSPG